MLGFIAFWRRDDDEAATKEYEDSRTRRVDKASIGNPVLRFIPPRFEIYAKDCPRDPLIRSISLRSGPPPSPNPNPNSLSHPSPSSPPSTPRFAPPPGSDSHSPYPLIRSYSLPAPVCPPLVTPSGSTSSVNAPPAARASSFSPLLQVTTIHTPLSPIMETCASPVSLDLKPTTSPKDSEISTLDLPSTNFIYHFLLYESALANETNV
ncbi:hypothetical protein C8R46DRAFT_1075517 [Mycena filopes]|nr:hypothetical protein C8R46DRAFT_1075517 [Mycena filopes]